jgi:hypothetical protein
MELGGQLNDYGFPMPEDSVHKADNNTAHTGLSTWIQIASHQSLPGRRHSVNGPAQDNFPIGHDHSEVWPCFKSQIAATSASMSSQVL